VPDESTVLRSGRRSPSSMMGEIDGGFRLGLLRTLSAGEMPRADEGERDRCGRGEGAPGRAREEDDAVVEEEAEEQVEMVVVVVDRIWLLSSSRSMMASAAVTRCGNGAGVGPLASRALVCSCRSWAQD